MSELAVSAERLTASEALDRGRAAFAAGSWAETYAFLTAAGRATPLDPTDLERLGIAAWLTGRGVESLEHLERLHQAWLAAGETSRAARAAVWLAVRFQFQGEAAQEAAAVERAARGLTEAHATSTGAAARP